MWQRPTGFVKHTGFGCHAVVASRCMSGSWSFARGTTDLQPLAWDLRWFLSAWSRITMASNMLCKNCVRSCDVEPPSSQTRTSFAVNPTKITLERYLPYQDVWVLEPCADACCSECSWKQRLSWQDMPSSMERASCDVMICSGMWQRLSDENKSRCFHSPWARHQEFNPHMTCNYPKFSLIRSTVSAATGGAVDGWRSKSRYVTN